MDSAELRKSYFWKKKIRKAVISRDADKNGFISRGDFELVLERYKKLTEMPAEKFQLLSKALQHFCDNLGLIDEIVQLTYEEFEQHWLSMNALKANTDIFNQMFVCLDTNGDGVISSEEWRVHNSAMGISPEHAKNSFHAMDADGDGKVTRKEFVDYHLEFFNSTENKLNSAILYGPL